MTWSNRVVWLEGMFLRAQHFQQQDRWLEALVRERTAALRPHGWGLTEGGQPQPARHRPVRREHGSGVFEDGTPFSLPGDTDQPVPLDLPESTRNAIVYLVLPMRQAGFGWRVTANGSGLGRPLRLQQPFEAYDTHSGSPQPAEAAGRRLRPALHARDREPCGLSRHRPCPPASRGRARTASVALDDQWIAPCLACSAAPPLTGLLAELAGLLNQRGEALAARLTAPGSRGVADVSDFLLLQSVNRRKSSLAHWAMRRRSIRPISRRPGADGRRLRDLHRSEPPSLGLSAVSACRPAAQLRPGDRRPAPLAVGGHRADRHPDPAAAASPTACASAPSLDRGILRSVELRAGRARPTCRPRPCGGCSRRRSRSARSSISASS